MNYQIWRNEVLYCATKNNKCTKCIRFFKWESYLWTIFRPYLMNPTIHSLHSHTAEIICALNCFFPLPSPNVIIEYLTKSIFGSFCICIGYTCAAASNIVYRIHKISGHFEMHIQFGKI